MLMNSTKGVAVSASRTYSNRSNCVAGARAVLGKAATVDVDFTVSKIGERFAWAPSTKPATAPLREKAPGLDAALAAAQGRSLDAALLAPASGSPGPRILANMANGRDPDDDGLGIPDMFKRQDTPEAAGRERTRRQMVGGKEGREISNPPNVKTKTAAAPSTRPDGLRQNSKQSVMLDMVLRPAGATEAEICKKLGWKACLVTLRRTCERVGVELRREPGKDGAKSRYFGDIKSDAKGRKS